ncbi:MAG: hypothetical protein WBC91_20405 [Phototrophicaceae bacterium]
MSENQLNRQLAAGIRAAQQGNRERARELLEGVLRRDRDNEQAWIWLASVVDNQRERRLSLERVLKINPSNQPAQQALNTMVGVLGSSETRPAINYAAISAAARTPAPITPGGGNQSPAERAGTANSSGTSLMPFLFGAAILLGLLLAGSIFIPPLLQPEPTATAVVVLQQATEDLGPTIDPSIPTSTATIRPSATFDSNSAGEIATNTPSGPTFTPTATLPPTETPLPTATLPALDVYDFLVRGFQGTAGSSIYRLDGTGGGLSNILPNVDDFDFNPETGVIVFTRRIFIEQPTLTPAPTRTPSDATPSSTRAASGGGFVVQNSGALPDLLQFQMFITNINAISTQTEITSSTLPTAFEPAISPDGNFVVFASDIDDDVELYLYDVATGLSEQITNNSVIEDTQPAWSPDGKLVVFSSDRVSAGNNDIFTIDPFDTDPESTVEQVTDTRGRNLNPQWSPNGDQIAYINVNEDETTIRLTSLNGRFIRDVTTNTSWVYTNPVWTPDGNYVVYSSRSADTVVPEIRSYSPLTNTEQTLIVPNFGALQVVIR